MDVILIHIHVFLVGNESVGGKEFWLSCLLPKTSQSGFRTTFRVAGIQRIRQLPNVDD